MFGLLHHFRRCVTVDRSIDQPFQGVISLKPLPIYLTAARSVMVSCPTGGGPCALSTGSHLKTHDPKHLETAEQPPYTNTGGGVELNTNGEPEIQGEETLHFLLTVPKGPAPAAGFPVTLVLHDVVLNALLRSVQQVQQELASDLAAIGMAMFSIEAPLYQSRNPGDVPDGSLFFNLTNLQAARGNIQQGVADALVARRFVQALSIPANETGDRNPIAFDAAKTFLVGHSIGAITGALALAIEGGWAGAYLSSAQGTALLSVFDKTEPAPLLPAVRALLGLPDNERLDAYYPTFALLQAFREPAMPAVLAPRIYRWSAGQGLDLWVSQALEDHTAPLEDNDILVLALGLQAAGETPRPIPALPLGGGSQRPLPVSLNKRASDGQRYTAVLSQHPDHDYGSFFTSVSLRRQLQHWLRSKVETGAAELPPAP